MFLIFEILIFTFLSVFFISKMWLLFDISLDLCVLYLWNVITLWHFSWSLCFLSLKYDYPLIFLLISVFFISEMWLPFDILLDLCVPYLWDINFRVSFSWSLFLSLRCGYPLTFLLISVFFISEMWLPLTFFLISVSLFLGYFWSLCYLSLRY